MEGLPLFHTEKNASICQLTYFPSMHAKSLCSSTDAKLLIVKGKIFKLQKSEYLKKKMTIKST